MGNTCGCSSVGESLVAAVEEDDMEAVQNILQGKSKKQLARYSSFVTRRTPLHCAAARGQHEILDLLLRAGADVDSRNYCGQTALMLAARFGHREAVQTLLLHNADVHAVDMSNGRTALHYACCGGKVQCARLLMADHIASVPIHVDPDNFRGDGGLAFSVREDSKWQNVPGRNLAALVNARADKGVTPLHLAAMNGHTEAVSLLLNVGARVNIMTRSEGDLLDVSVMGMHNSPLHYAASSGNILCCQILLAHGASRSKENGNGWTPYYIAKLWRHSRALEDLLDPEQPWPQLPMMRPSRYLVLPLNSIFRAARELGIDGCRRVDASLHGGEAQAPGGGGEPGASCCASDRVCPVCMERHCTVAADGCNHELCTLCALNLCSVGGHLNSAPWATGPGAGGTAAPDPPGEGGGGEPSTLTFPGVEASSASGADEREPEGTAPEPGAPGEANAEPASLPVPGVPVRALVRRPDPAVAAATYGSLPCPLCRHPTICFFQLPLANRPQEPEEQVGPAGSVPGPEPAPAARNPAQLIGSTPVSDSMKGG